jgi:hypothetical protein
MVSCLYSYLVHGLDERRDSSTVALGRLDCYCSNCQDKLVHCTGDCPDCWYTHSPEVTGFKILSLAERAKVYLTKIGFAPS